jgi:hypothetical protein
MYIFITPQYARENYKTVGTRWFGKIVPVPTRVHFFLQGRRCDSSITMKSLGAAFLPLAVSASLQLPGFPAPGLGANGFPNITDLANFDMARLGPLLAAAQPYFKPVVKSGLLATVGNMFAPTARLDGKIAMKPRFRQSAKRAKSRLGPFKLVGKNVSTI